MRSSKATSVPRNASSESAPITSAVSTRVSAASSARIPTASIACVPLISETASLASSTSGLIWARRIASAAGTRIAFLVKTFAFADQRQRQVRQGSQIAAGSHAALRRHHRSDAAIQHLANRVDDGPAHSGVSFGK